MHKGRVALQEGAQPATAERERGRNGNTRRRKQLQHVVVAPLQCGRFRRITTATGPGGVLGVVQTAERRRVDLMRCRRHSHGMSKLRNAALLQVGHSHVTLQQVKTQSLRTSKFTLEMGRGRHGHRHLVVHPLPLHKKSAHKQPRTWAHTGVHRLAILHRLIGRTARTAHGGHAKGQVRLHRVGAEVLLQVRVEFDQPGHHGVCPRIHNPCTDMMRRRVRHHPRNAVPVHHDVDIAA